MEMLSWCETSRSNHKRREKFPGPGASEWKGREADFPKTNRDSPGSLGLSEMQSS